MQYNADIKDKVYFINTGIMAIIENKENQLDKGASIQVNSDVNLLSVNNNEEVAGESIATLSADIDGFSNTADGINFSDMAYDIDSYSAFPLIDEDKTESNITDSLPSSKAIEKSADLEIMDISDSISEIFDDTHEEELISLNENSDNKKSNTEEDFFNELETQISDKSDSHESDKDPYILDIDTVGLEIDDEVTEKLDDDENLSFEKNDNSIKPVETIYPEEDFSDNDVPGKDDSLIETQIEDVDKDKLKNSDSPVKTNRFKLQPVDMDEIGYIDLQEAEAIANEDIVFLNEDDLVSELSDLDLKPVENFNRSQIQVKDSVLIVPDHTRKIDYDNEEDFLILEDIVEVSENSTKQTNDITPVDVLEISDSKTLENDAYDGDLNFQPQTPGEILIQEKPYDGEVLEDVILDNEIEDDFIREVKYISDTEDQLTVDEKNSIEQDISKSTLVIEEDINEICEAIGKRKHEITEPAVIEDISERIILLEDERSVDAFVNHNIPIEKQEDLKRLLEYLDGLFEALPEEVLKKFTGSEYFDLYIKVMDDLGL